MTGPMPGHMRDWVGRIPGLMSRILGPIRAGILGQILGKLLGRGIVGNAAALYAVQGLNYLVPLLLLPYLLRVLSPEGYGSIMLAQSLMGYAIILTEFGFNLTAARDISVARDDPAKLARIYWTTLAAKTLLMIISLTAVAAVVFLTPAFRREWPVYAASTLLVVGNVAFPQWYFQGLERLRETAAIQAAAKCLIALGAVLLVRSANDTWIAAVILSSPQLVGAIAARLFGKSLAPASFYTPSPRDIVGALRHSSHMFASIVSTTLYLHSNTLILGLMCGERQVALYSLATRLTATLQSVASPLIQSVFPRASFLFAQQPAEAWKLVKRAAVIVLPAVAAACLALGLAAPWIVHVLGGVSYEDAYPVVRIMAATPLLITIAAGLSQTIMVNLGLTRALLWIYLAVGCLNLILLPLLVLRYAAVGAAIALLLAETLGPLLMIRALRRYHAPRL